MTDPYRLVVLSVELLVVSIVEPIIAEGDANAYIDSLKTQRQESFAGLTI